MVLAPLHPSTRTRWPLALLYLPRHARITCTHAVTPHLPPLLLFHHAPLITTTHPTHHLLLSPGTRGGALRVAAGSNVTLADCLFLGNEAALGGAVYVEAGGVLAAVSGVLLMRNGNGWVGLGWVGWV